jgi:hypothetical protein
MSVKDNKSDLTRWQRFDQESISTYRELLRESFVVGVIHWRLRVIMCKHPAWRNI